MTTEMEYLRSSVYPFVELIVLVIIPPDPSWCCKVAAGPIAKEEVGVPEAPMAICLHPTHGRVRTNDAIVLLHLALQLANSNKNKIQMSPSISTGIPSSDEKHSFSIP